MKDFLYLHVRDLPYFRGLLRSVESQYYQDIDLPSPTLDVGCGDGHFTQLTFDRKLEVGIDPWWPPILEAGSRNVYDRLTQADGAKMPYPDSYFSSAVSNSAVPPAEVTTVSPCSIESPAASLFMMPFAPRANASPCTVTTVAALAMTISLVITPATRRKVVLWRLYRPMESAFILS